MDTNINLVAVLIATLSSMFVGFIWYGPLFGKTWMKLMGMKESSMDKSGANKMYAITAAGAFVSAYVLAHFIALMKITDISGALELAFWAWLGFTAAKMLPNYLFGGKGLNLYVLDALQHLVVILVMAVILVSWR